MAFYRLGAFALVLATAAAGPVAHAQRAGKQAAATETMTLEADRFQLDDQNLRATFEGRVRAQQGTLSIASDRAVAMYNSSLLKSSAAPDLTKVQATGHVVVKRPDETASGDYAVYNLNERIITLVGNVVLIRGSNVVRGARLAINLDSNSATLGGGANVGAATPTGRVSGSFSVPKRTDGSTPSTATPPTQTPSPKP